MLTGAAVGPIRGHVRAARHDEAFDYAVLVFPENIPIAGLFDDTHPISDVYVPTGHERNIPLFVLSPRGLIEATLDGVRLNTRADPPGRGGAATYRHAILTTSVTEPGDSGSLLVDEHFRPWGTLRGRAQINGVWRSVFASAHMMVDAIITDTRIRPPQ
jgi:hypothetical protein